jgi:hypothetical protein
MNLASLIAVRLFIGLAVTVLPISFASGRRDFGSQSLIGKRNLRVSWAPVFSESLQP